VTYHFFVHDTSTTITSFGPPGVPTFPTSINPAGKITGYYNDFRGYHGFVRNPSADIIPDTTPPLIVPQIGGNAGNNGWYRSTVTIDWGVADPESGIASSTGCGSVSLYETAGATFT